MNQYVKGEKSNIAEEQKKPTRCHLLFYCNSYRFNMFRALYAHHQELATMMLITTLVVSFLVCCMLEVR